VIRRARAADAAQIVAIYAPIVERTAISFEEIAPSVEQTREHLETAGEIWPRLVMEDDGAILGFVYASAHRARAAYRWSLDVSAYVREDARGRGVARSLYDALFRIVTVQGFHRAYAGITLPNDASVALHRALGFTPIGVYREVGYKFGRWHDVSWWERSLAAVDPPREPTPVAELPPATLAELIGA
jgi:L-amino acid N-acyltransferase YncA